MARVLTPQAEDVPRWYQDVIAKAELADNGPVRGTMVIRPYGYAIWERMQAEMDARIKAAGAQNAYFPLFIPESYFRREAEYGVVMAVKPEVADAVHRVAAQLAERGVRVQVDDRTDVPFGRRAVDWELKGVPVRIEIGPRDLAANTATLARRLSGGKAPAALDGLAEEVVALLAAEQQAMLADARAHRDARIADVDSLEDAAAAATEGWARISWARLGVEGEATLAQSAVTVRCLQRPDGSVPESEDERI